jgi:hypothetical protein
MMSPKTAKICAQKAQQLHHRRAIGQWRSFWGRIQVAMNYIRE